MIPQLIVSINKKSHKTYIQSFCEKDKIAQTFIFNFEPVEGQFTIDQLKELKSLISITSSGIRLFIIWSFELASTQIQNILLKLLEEESDRVYFLLCTTTADSAIETIRSRVQVINLNNKKIEALPAETISEFDKLIKEMEDGHSSLGNPIIPKSKDDYVTFLDSFSQYLRMKLVLEKNNKWSLCLQQVWKTKELLINTQMQAGLTVDNLLIFVKKTVTMK